MLQVIPSSLTQPPVPTSWESKLVAALPLPNLDICEAIQPAIPYRYRWWNGVWIWLRSLGSFLFLHGQFFLRFHESSRSVSYSFNKKTWYFTWMRKSNLHDEWLWMEICTRASILGWNPRTDGPMDKKHGPWQDIYHNWYRTWSEQLPIQSLEASHLGKTQTAPIFCNNVVIIYYVSDCSDDYYYITNSLPDLHCQCWSSLLIF